MKSSPLGSLDPAGLATFKNFPGDKIAAAKAALEEAKQKLQKCKDDGKCDKRKSYLENLIRKMDSATYVYDPSLVDCGFTSYFSLFSVRLGPPAFSFNTCCDLSSTLAHEANHLRNWGSSGSEDASRQLEKECFNCPRRSK